MVFPFSNQNKFFFFFLNKISQGELNRSPLLLQVRRLSPSVWSKDRNSRFLVAAFDWGGAEEGGGFCSPISLQYCKEILFPLSLSRSLPETPPRPLQTETEEKKKKSEMRIKTHPAAVLYTTPPRGLRSPMSQAGG